jgi:hypothetical protein
MSRTLKLIGTVLVAAAITAPIANAGTPKVDPLAVSWLRGHGYSASQIAAMTGNLSSVSTQVKLDPLAVSWLRGHGYTPSQIQVMTGGLYLAGAGSKVDPLAVSYLRSRGLSPSEVKDWTVGACSHQVKPASCFAVFDRTGIQTQAATSGGFQWGDAGIGAGATGAIVLILAGVATFLVFGRRRHAAQA